MYNFLLPMFTLVGLVAANCDTGLCPGSFPNKTLEETFGDQVRTCCTGHNSYIFTDFCDVSTLPLNTSTQKMNSPLSKGYLIFQDRPELHGKRVCGHPDSAPKEQEIDVDELCPAHCNSHLGHHFNLSNIGMNLNSGNFQIINPSQALKVSQ